MNDSYTNSIDYWNARFSLDWEKNKGREQTKFFCNLAIQNLPNWIINDIRNRRLDICDFGCALGDCVNILSNVFKECRIIGIDISDNAIEGAKEYYPENEFICTDVNNMKDSYPVIFSSNTLEHFENPLEFVRELLTKVEKYLIILVPFQEIKRIDEHVFTFDYNNFPMRLKNFSLIYCREIDCRTSNENFWDGSQLLIVYGNDKYINPENITLSSIKQGEYELINKIKQRDTEKNDLSNKLINLEYQLKDRDNLMTNLESQLKDKKLETAMLQDILRQRDNSLSWRFSQSYGKYFPRNSRFTRFISYIIKKIISSPLSEKKSTMLTENIYQKDLENILKNHKGTIKGIIVYPPTVDWDIPLFQRPQQLALKLSDLGYLFFFSTGSNEFDKVNGFRKIKDNCYVTNQYDLLIKELSGFILMLSSTNLVIRQEDIITIKENILTIYDYIDEIHQDISGSLSINNSLQRHGYMIKNSDMIIATADKLFDDIRKIREKDVYIIQNGVDYDHFHIKKDDKKIPKDIQSIIKNGHPVIGYYGALAKWFDYELIKELAKKRPNYEIILIGWDYDNSIHDQNLERFKNIHYLGIKKYPILPIYAIWFDIAIIPFVLNEITESTSPIKIFEYMALGKPIVTTDMRECRKYSSVLIGKGHDNFIEKIDDALRLRTDSSYLKLLDKEAKENTWKSRSEKIDEAIQGYQKKKNLKKL